MRAAWYEKQGPAREVLTVGEMPDPVPLEAEWTGFSIGERVPLAEIARAHELVEHPARPGRVVVTL